MPKHPAGGGDSGCRVFVLLCNILTVAQKNHAPMLETITPTMDACSRMLFEAPLFSCRKKVLQRRLANLSPGTPLPAALPTQRGAWAWRHQGQGPERRLLGSARPS